MIRENPGTRAICACFLSSVLPYCDGQHLGTGIEPFMVQVTEEKEIAWCACGDSIELPLCDDKACRD